MKIGYMHVSKQQQHEAFSILMTQMTEEIITSAYAGVSLCHAALFHNGYCRD
jgi:hypothetical protein